MGELGVTEMRCRNDLEQRWRRPRIDKDGIVAQMRKKSGFIPKLLIRAQPLKRVLVFTE